MNKSKAGQLYDFYNSFLFENCLPFWLKNSLDRRFGGYYTCLDRSGSIYDTNKAIWFQGRGTWLYSRVFNICGGGKEFLDAARLGYEFLIKHGFDSDCKAFLEVTAEGKPVKKADDIFSEAFATIAFAEYYKASGDSRALELALQTFRLILDICRNHSAAAETSGSPGATGSAGTAVASGSTDESGIACVSEIAGSSYRSIHFMAHAVPMILLSTIQVLRDGADITELGEIAEWLVEIIFRDFMLDGVPVIIERAADKALYPTSISQCHIKPGHSIETAWFIIHEGIYRKDGAMVKKALEILDGSLETGWDNEYGGIIYHTDKEGTQGEDGPWHSKLWWPQTEALYAALLAYQVTGDQKYENWFDKIHEWSFSRFADPEHGEWYLDLYRDGTVRNSSKGSLWKGPFHLPRALLYCLGALDKLKDGNSINISEL